MKNLSKYISVTSRTGRSGKEFNNQMSRSDQSRGEVLVAILKEKADLGILQEQGWYRIPVANAPNNWPPKWIAFYQPKIFQDDAYKIRYFGQVKNIEVVKRCDLFPNEIPNARSQKEYYRIELERIEECQQPITSTRPRRLVFVPTTWRKFSMAEHINDLFDDSPLEDRMWSELKKLKIDAERQWSLKPKQYYYQLDFALFCRLGQVDIETDGDTWHSTPDRILLDNQRNNELEAIGWHVLRFSSSQIMDELESYCLGNIEDTINRLGGLCNDGVIPRIFYPKAGKNIQQLSLFEEAENGYLSNEDLD